jgi:long-chain acyl-CoA synthetase
VYQALRSDPTVPSNFASRIADTAARLPGHIAIERVRSEGVDTTDYAALTAEARRFGGWLATSGFVRGDRAALLADNSADWIAAYLGILWLGGVAVPLDTAYKAAQVQTVLESSGARVLFTTPRYLETARTVVSGISGAAGITLVLIEAGPPGLVGPTEVRQAAPLDAPAEVESGDRAVMLYTSGTTADPKGVVLTHGNLDAERNAALAIIDATERDAVLGVLPLFHALAQMANLLLPLAVGARVVFLETVSSTSLLEALATRGITIFACVPQFFYLIHQRVTSEVATGGGVRVRLFRTLLAVNRVCRDRFSWNPGRRWFARVHTRLGSSMRILITGGSRFDEGIGRDLYAMGFTILNAYGLTETSGGATVQRPGDRFTTSVGQPLPGIDVRIGSTAAEGSDDRADGEILIRGPIVMREYFGRPDATREAIDAEGWLHTGDLGRLDEAGRLYITGRKKEIIVLSSGKNLYPEEIEAHYRQSPFIGEVCVLGLTRPGEPSAERLHAVIVPNAEAIRARGIVNVGDTIRFEVETWSASLAAHKRILSYDISTDPLPRTTTGKLKRHEIEKLALARAEAKATPGDRPLDDAARAWLADDRTSPLVRVIAARLDRPAIHPADNLELDLGLDSMERVELMTLLERQAGTAVTPETRATIFTVRQLVDAVLEGTPVRSAAATATEPAWSAILAGPPDAELERQLGRSRRGRAILFFAMLKVWLAVVRLFVRVRVVGRAEVPDHGACLLCPNHQTFFDGFLLAATLPMTAIRRIFYVGASELFETRSARWFARQIDLVPIDPDAHLVDAMRAGASGLRLGRMLMLFPEGERSIDGELKRFRKGAAILAGVLGVPVVPVGLSGLYPLWPRAGAIQWRAFWPFRRRLITIAFGPPIHVKAGDETRATELMRQAVETLLTATAKS